MRSRSLILAILAAGLVFSSGSTACSRNVVLHPSEDEIRYVEPGTQVGEFVVVFPSYLVTADYLRYIALVRLEEAR